MEWIKCSEQFPKMGDQIILAYPLPSGKFTWCAGEVDGSDDGLFVDYELDGQSIDDDCYWIAVPSLPTNAG